MKRVPIKVAEDIAKQLGMRVAILVLVEPPGSRMHVVTYGKSYNDCVWAAIVGNRIKRDVLRWPDKYCHDKPARQLRKERNDSKRRKD